MKKTMFITVEESEKINDEWSAYIRLSKFDEEIINLIKSEPIRFYNKGTGNWEVPMTSVDGIVEKVSNIDIVLTQGGEEYRLNK